MEKDGLKFLRFSNEPVLKNLKIVVSEVEQFILKNGTK
jgi:very-short-patch-repair endonuclease